jgi:hypothetical protein
MAPDASLRSEAVDSLEALQAVAPKPIIRRATVADYREFYGKSPEITVRGIAGELDGRVLAFGGIARQRGIPYIFFDMKEEARPHKKAIVKGAFALLQMIGELPPGLPVSAVANPNEKTAPRFLTRLGFVPIGDAGYILKR